MIFTIQQLVHIMWFFTREFTKKKKLILSSLIQKLLALALNLVIFFTYSSIHFFYENESLVTVVFFSSISYFSLTYYFLLPLSKSKYIYTLEFSIPEQYWTNCTSILRLIKKFIKNCTHGITYLFSLCMIVMHSVQAIFGLSSMSFCTFYSE